MSTCGRCSGKARWYIEHEAQAYVGSQTMDTLEAQKWTKMLLLEVK